MELISKDFSLNFRGFAHEDPETVRRFTAFCEANFSLSPEQTTLLGSKPDTVVLTHGGSLDELEALAEVLREIGAVVDVSAEDGGDLSSLRGGPSTQGLHRLFGAQSPRSNADRPQSCPYPPPLGRSLYLLSNSNAVVDRRSLRVQTGNEITSTEVHSTTTRSSHTMPLALCLLALGVGLAALATAAILLKKETKMDVKKGSSFTQSRHIDATHTDLGSSEDITPRMLTSTTNAHSLGVELKVLASAKALSVSFLSFTPQTASQSHNGIDVKRIVGEPTFLTETAPGEWQGTVLLSVFLEEDGISSHFTTPAEVEIRVNADRSIARASVRMRSAASKDEGAISVTRLDSDTFRVSGLLVEELSLS